MPCFSKWGQLHPGGEALGREAPIFKGGYDACTRKRVKRVVFLTECMYAGTLKKVSKTVKFGKKGMFFNPWNCDMCLGYNTHSRFKIEKMHD